MAHIRKMQTDAIDTQWFVDRIADKKLSQRRLAKLLGMDPSSFSLLLHGKRRMNIDRATDIARLLGVPVATVIRKAGVIVDEHTGHRSIPLVGTLDAEGRATMDWAATKERVPVNAELPPDAVALRWRTMQTAGDLWDGWMNICTTPQEPSPDMIGRTGLVEIRGDGVYSGQVRRGYGEGRYTLVRAGMPPMHDVEIAWFAPLLLIIPN